MNKNISEELSEKVFAISRIIKGSMIYKSALYHLSLLQIQALEFLSRNEHAQMSEIADYLRIELSSATSLLNKLYELRLVERQNDPNDRRLVRIILTEEGKRLIKEASRERNEKVERILSFLPDTDKNELLRILKIIYNKMEEDK
jgi:DNA-binding MarR family transcriptional regulator